MAREKKPVHRVQMIEGKRNIIHQLLEEYDIQSMDITKKWTGHQQDCGQIHSQLEIFFEERLSGL